MFLKLFYYVNEYIIFFYGILFLVLIVIVVFFFDVLGEGFFVGSGFWCWIKDCESIKLSFIFWMLIMGKVWEIVVYFGILVIYIVLKC